MIQGVISKHTHDSKNKTAPLRPLEGWPLPVLLALDRKRPGLLASLMQARDGRRQVVYAALASGAASRPQDYAPLLGRDACGWHGADFEALFGEALVTADPRAILQATFGGIPDGMLAALNKSGPTPRSTDFYGRLHAIYSDPASRRRRQLLMHSPVIDENDLYAAEHLPTCTLHPNILRLADRPYTVDQICAAVEIALKHTPATATSILKSISDLKPETRFRFWIERLLTSFDKPGEQPNVGKINGAVLLDTSEKLSTARRSYRNCLGSFDHCFDVLTGRSAYVEDSEFEVIVAMKRLGSGWVCAAVYKAHNVEVASDLAQAVFDKFDAAGFPAIGGPALSPALAKLKAHSNNFWDDDFD